MFHFHRLKYNQNKKDNGNKTKMDGNGGGLLIRYFRLSCTLMCVCVCTIQNRWDRVCASSSSQPPTPTHTHTDTHSDFIDFCFWDSFLLERAKVQQFFFFVSFVKLSLPASPRMYIYVLNGSSMLMLLLSFLFCNGPNRLPEKNLPPSDIHIDMYACI